MNTDDKKILVDMPQLMFLLINTRCEITKLEVKNQNAPKYLHEQARDLQGEIMRAIYGAD